jgi:predicted metal-dependent hydrolase
MSASRDRSLTDPAPQLQLPLFGAAGQAAGPMTGDGSAQPGERVTLLSGQPVNWQLVRAKRRSIGFRIDHRGLRVSAPRWVSLREIDQALQTKASWILRKLAEWRLQSHRNAALTTRWEDGGEIRVLGERLTLSTDPTAPGIEREAGILRIDLPRDAPSEQVKDRVESWLRSEALRIFAERMPIYAARLGRAPTRWALSSARTRWGSCTRDGSIRLNWRLIHFPIDLIDYVIAHELAHLVELNHSPRFWSTVGSLFPEYESARRRLRALGGEAAEPA